MGNGQSGSGKTSLLVFFRKKMDNQPTMNIDGIIPQICNGEKIKSKFDIIKMKCIELYVVFDNIDDQKEIRENHHLIQNLKLSPNTLTDTGEYYITKEKLNEAECKTFEPEKNPNDDEWIYYDPDDKIDHGKKTEDEQKQNPLRPKVLAYGIDKLLNKRFIAPTKNNPNSSRSHVFILLEFLKFKKDLLKDEIDNIIKNNTYKDEHWDDKERSKMVICDLAGVEDKFKCGINDVLTMLEKLPKNDMFSDKSNNNFRKIIADNDLLKCDNRVSGVDESKFSKKFIGGSQNASTNSELENAIKQKTQAEVEKSKLESELDKLNTQIDPKKKEITDLEEKIQKLETDKDTIENNIDENETNKIDNRQEKQKLAAKEIELNSKEKDLEKQDTELDNLETEIDKIQEQIDELNEKIKDLNESIKDLTPEGEEENNDFNEYISYQPDTGKIVYPYPSTYRSKVTNETDYNKDISLNVLSYLNIITKKDKDGNVVLDPDYNIDEDLYNKFKYVTYIMKIYAEKYNYLYLDSNSFVNKFFVDNATDDNLSIWVTFIKDFVFTSLYFNNDTIFTSFKAYDDNTNKLPNLIKELRKNQTIKKILEYTIYNCFMRRYEGFIINRSLNDMRTTMSNLIFEIIKSKINDKNPLFILTPNIYNENEDNPLYCYGDNYQTNNNYKYFYDDNNFNRKYSTSTNNNGPSSAIFQIIFGKSNEDFKDQKNIQIKNNSCSTNKLSVVPFGLESKTCSIILFTIINVTADERTNNPPNPPYIKTNKLVQIKNILEYLKDISNNDYSNYSSKFDSIFKQVLVKIKKYLVGDFTYTNNGDQNIISDIIDNDYYKEAYKKEYGIKTDINLNNPDDIIKIYEIYKKCRLYINAPDNEKSEFFTKLKEVTNINEILKKYYVKGKNDNTTEPILSTPIENISMQDAIKIINDIKNKFKSYLDFHFFDLNYNASNGSLKIKPQNKLNSKIDKQPHFKVIAKNYQFYNSIFSNNNILKNLYCQDEFISNITSKIFSKTPHPGREAQAATTRVITKKKFTKSKEARDKELKDAKENLTRDIKAQTKIIKDKIKVLSKTERNKKKIGNKELNDKIDISLNDLKESQKNQINKMKIELKNAFKVKKEDIKSKKDVSENKKVPEIKLIPKTDTFDNYFNNDKTLYEDEYKKAQKQFYDNYGKYFDIRSDNTTLISNYIEIIDELLKAIESNNPTTLLGTLDFQEYTQFRDEDKRYITCDGINNTAKLNETEIVKNEFEELIQQGGYNNEYFENMKYEFFNHNNDFIDINF